MRAVAGQPGGRAAIGSPPPLNLGRGRRGWIVEELSIAVISVNADGRSMIYIKRHVSGPLRA